MFLRKPLLFFLLITSFPAFAQKLKKADKAVISRLEAHVRFLADDRLEGRRAGSAGEKLAMEYIAAEFKKAGLAPKGDNGGFYQAFEIWDGKDYAESSYLFINDVKIEAADYFPLPASPPGTIEGNPSMALRESGEPWFLDVKEDMQAAAANPHFNQSQYLHDKAREAAGKGATALFIYNSDTRAEDATYDGKERSEALAIPVVLASKKLAQTYFSDEAEGLKIRLNLAFKDRKRTGHNVIGYIDNKAASTVVIGAHYDHLGYGEDGGSLLRTNEKAIHNGADDNASGTAGLIELSRLLKLSRSKNNNYLLIAFSGEELGLFGSRHFVEHPTVDISKINFMINLDMIGRLNDSTHTLTIGGVGTSPAWADLFKTSPVNVNFTNRYDSSGNGPSDHTSFYLKEIPVLFFFTGYHNDYHRPTDDFDKLNYTGEFRVLQYIVRLIDQTNKQGKVAFTKTRDMQMQRTPRFSVTMGIMPDYTYAGAGVRVDGISEGRPAEKAGVKTGDVVIQLGDHAVSSMETYMQALGKFKKGDKAQVKLKRGDETIQTEIVF